MIRHLSQCQRKVKGYHTTELFLSALGPIIFIYTRISLLRTEKKKRDLSRWKIFILSISIRVFEGKMCTRSTTSNNLHVPAALIRRFISLLSERKETAADWSHSRVQMPTKLSHFLTETNV